MKNQQVQMEGIDQWIGHRQVIAIYRMARNLPNNVGQRAEVPQEIDLDSHSETWIHTQRQRASVLTRERVPQVLGTKKRMLTQTLIRDHDLSLTSPHWENLQTTITK